MSINLNQLSKSDAPSIPFDEVMFALFELDEDAQFIPIKEINSKSLIEADDETEYHFGISELDLLKMPADEKNKTLRQRIRTLWFEEAEGSYDKLEYLSQIKQNTFQKWINGSRNVKRSELAKFVIGLSLDIETANELFALRSHPLDCDGNRFDYIVACAIRDKDDIGQFGEDVYTYCNLQLF